MITLGTCLDAGYEDYEQIRTDPDLENLRADERFANVMGKFDKGSSASGGIMGWLSYQMNPKNSAIYRATQGKK